MKYKSGKKKSDCVCGETTHIQNIMRLHVISRSSSCITGFCFPLPNVCFKHPSKAPDDKLFTLKSGVKQPQRRQPCKDQERGNGEGDWAGRALRSSSLRCHCAQPKGEKQFESPVWKKERPLKTVFQNAILFVPAT